MGDGDDDLGFRDLVRAIHEAPRGTDLRRALLEPWLPRARAIVEDCEIAFHRDASETRDVDLTPISWDLYALQRLTELLNDLVVSEQRREVFGFGLDADDYADFMVALGFRRVFESAFHPFWHEVFAVDPCADAAPTIIEEVWPGFVAGHLLISRAGVRVHSGPAHLRAGIADQSTLYFTRHREWRPAEDLSHGWGSNSQWRTSFRRDYVVDDTFIFNAGGKKMISGDDRDLSEAERIELIRHRCFVTCEKPHHDRWPYDDRWVELRKTKGELGR